MEVHATSNVIGKMGAGFDSAAQSMKNASVNCKLDARIAKEEKKIRKLAGEIGALALRGLDAGETTSEPEMRQRYEAIRNARKEIKAAESEKVMARAACPKCGSKAPAGMQRCGVCGETLNPAV